MARKASAAPSAPVPTPIVDVPSAPIPAPVVDVTAIRVHAPAADAIRVPAPAVDAIHVVAAPPVVDAAAPSAAATDLVRAARSAVAAAPAAELAGTARVNQLVGMARYAELMENANRVARLKAMLRLRESGEYKNLPVENTKGEIVCPRNFDDLCAAVGTSRGKVEEDARNLSFFGEKLLEQQKELGIGYRELRAMRAEIRDLPEDEQETAKGRMAQAVESGDKTAVRDLLEDLVDEKKALAQKLAEAGKAVRNAEDQATVLKMQRDEKSGKINDLEMRLTMALNPATEDERRKNLNAARSALCARLDGMCNSLAGNAASMSNCIINARKSDTESADCAEGGPCDPVIDAAMWEHINSRVSIMCRTLRGLLLDAGLDADFDTI